MPFYPVLEYQADWNAKLNKYRIQIRCDGNPEPFLLDINSEAEYISVLLMLGRSRVEYEPKLGNFKLGPRPVGS